MTQTIGEFYKDKTVFVTGHTGFKGSWLCLWLASLGARLTGFSDKVPTDPSAFDLMKLATQVEDRRGGIADLAAVIEAMTSTEPEIVFHLAAQPIVRLGFKNPYETFNANVMGTVAVLEAARRAKSVKAVVVVTSDKVYDNTGLLWAFRENDRLGGHEPYGASKAAAEIVTMTYQSPGFHKAAGSANVPIIASARAGNVIGGGDWAADRLIPDFVRAISQNRNQIIRQPRATRPWQHVLEPVGGYLLLAAALAEKATGTPQAVNFGPQEPRMLNVAEVARTFLRAMGEPTSRMQIEEDEISGEAPTLRVDSSLAAAALSWSPAWDAAKAIDMTARWYKRYLGGGKDMLQISRDQLAEYCSTTPVGRLKN